MQLMIRNLWGIVSRKEKPPIDANKLLEWNNTDDKEKIIIGLALVDFELPSHRFR